MENRQTWANRFTPPEKVQKTPQTPGGEYKTRIRKQEKDKNPIFSCCEFVLENGIQEKHPLLTAGANTVPFEGVYCFPICACCSITLPIVVKIKLFPREGNSNIAHPLTSQYLWAGSLYDGPQ